MILYLAGPMRNRPDNNYPMFDEVAEYLRGEGHTVFSPAEHARAVGQVPGVTTDDADGFIWDTAAILEVDAVVVLPGWDRSRGARLEVELARCCGKQVLHEDLTELSSFEVRAGRNAASESDYLGPASTPITGGVPV